MSVTKLAGAAVFVVLWMLMLSVSAGALTLADHGATAYVIVIADNAIAPERTAANELASTLRQVTGADFPVVTESKADFDAPVVLVGRTKLAKKLLATVDWDSLGSDGIIIKTVGGRLILSGGRPRGTLYAVYSFLEDTVGCRWWTSTESYTPRVSVLTVPALDTVYVPKLKYREAFYRDPLEDPKFAVKMKLDGNFNAIPPEYGGHDHILGWCHTAYQLLPPKKYFKDHPEWYSQVNGKRTGQWAQLCWSNDEMRKELTKNALEWIKKDPTAGIISISQNDCLGACECDKCKAIEAEEGSQAGPLIRFVNAVAADIEKQYPNVLIETLAYTYTRQAPLHVKPRNNVIIRLCSIECNFVAPLDSDVNPGIRDQIKKWSAISPHLYVWNYVTDFANYIVPFPNMRALATDLRFFVKNNSIGVFEQGDSATTVGDFVRLRNYILAHLMWNPDLDQQKLTAEFLQGYYGAAAPYVQRYLDLVHDAAGKKGPYLNCFNGDFSFMTFDDMAQATRLFDKAQAAVASDGALSERVRRDRMPLDHLWLLRYTELRAEAKTRGIPFPGPSDGKAACNEFIAMARKWNARNFSEAQSFETYVPALKAQFAPPAPKPEEFADLPKEDVLEIQQDSFELARVGEWTSIVDDPAASDGKAARMTADHGNQAIQFHISDDFAKAHPGQWHCYMIVRGDGAPDGAAVRYGLYYAPEHRDGVAMSTTLAVVGGPAYHTLYLGSHELKKGYFFWAAPWSNPDVVKGIYVDRIVLVKNKGD